MKKNNKTDIFFIQPSYAHYRNQLFSILSKQHDIHFVFERSYSGYPGKTKPANISCTFLDQGFGIYPIRLFYYLIKHRPNIVISSTSYSSRSIVCFLFAILFNKRFILWIVEWRNRRLSSYTLKRVWRYLRNITGILIIKYSHSLVVGGLAAKNYALSIGKNESNIFIANQSTDDLKLKQDIKCQKMASRSKKYALLYMSRIIPRKGLDILIKAFSLLKKKRDDVCLLIGGDGPFLPYCKKLAKTFDIQDISFLGPISLYSVVNLYRQADVFILPSRFWENMEEPWGLVVNEAMSLGLPIITTTAVGAAYDLVIDGYNGFIVKDNDVEELYKAMDRIISLDLSQMGMNSRLLFEKKNDFVRMAGGFTSAIENAISK